MFDVASVSTSSIGPSLSMFDIFIVWYVASFPASSLTFITIPAVFWLYVFVLSACHVFPPSKLYAFSCNPLSLSWAITVNVTSLFVHPSLCPSTSIVGNTLSSIGKLAYAVVFIPSVSLAIIKSPSFKFPTVSVLFSAFCHPPFNSISSPFSITLYSIWYSVLFVTPTLACLFDQFIFPNSIFPFTYTNSWVVASVVPSPWFPIKSVVVTFMLYVVWAFNAPYVYVTSATPGPTNLYSSSLLSLI